VQRNTWAALDPHPNNRRKTVPTGVSHPAPAAHSLGEIPGVDRLLGPTRPDIGAALKPAAIFVCHRGRRTGSIGLWRSGWTSVGTAPSASRQPFAHCAGGGRVTAFPIADGSRTMGRWVISGPSPITTRRRTISGADGPFLSKGKAIAPRLRCWPGDAVGSSTRKASRLSRWYFRARLEHAGLGAALSRGAMGELGFFVCDEDLEDELIRALGPDAVEGIIESQGELIAVLTYLGRAL
jgi:hypothetical protein